MSSILFLNNRGRGRGRGEKRTRGSTRRPSRRGARGGRGSRGGRQTCAPNRADIALQTKQRRDQERQVSDCKTYIEVEQTIQCPKGQTTIDKTYI
jgi:hypothetical protein